jgi:hypothetical protein
VASLALDSFETSTADPTPPAGLGRPLEALWHERKGDWHRAHELAQAEDGPDGAWVHTYLHRIEGDLGNAAYWYRRAGRPVCDQPLPDEWRSIARALLDR